MKYLVTLLLISLFSNYLFCQINIVEPANSNFSERIINEINKIKIIDTHEHLELEEDRINKLGKIDFTYLFRHYAKEDFISSSNNKGIVEIIYNNNYPLDDRWELFKNVYDQMRNTSYAKVPLIIARDIYKVKEISEETYKELSDKVNKISKPGLYKSILKEKANIELSIQDMGHRRFDPEFYKHVERFDNFVLISSKSEILDYGEKYIPQVLTLKDYIDALRNAFLEGVNYGMVGVKSGLAYKRIIKYENVSKERAEIVFNSLIAESSISENEIKELQDYLMHKLLELVDEYNLPIQIHTGLHAGNGNLITNSKPTHLTNLFMEFPNVNFILFHGGYPYGGELGVLAKNFPNVFIDMCWNYVISPSYSERYLHEWLETVPANKIMAFGGDYNFVEAVYAHSVIARQVIAKVLIKKVKDRYMTESEAINIAKMILRDNAIKVFNLFENKDKLEEINVLKKNGPIKDWWELYKNKNGFIKNWKVIGPFKYGDGLNGISAPEREINFNKSYKGNGGIINWNSEIASSSGYLNFISIVSNRYKNINPKSKGIIYAYAEVISPNKQKIKLTIGSNDGAKIWINNNVVYNKHAGRNAIADQDMIEIDIVKGKNRVLVKVENLGSSWGLFMRIIDPKNELILNQFKD